MLKERNVEIYIPLRSVERVVQGRKVRRRIPAIASLMFMRCQEELAGEIQRELRGQAMIYTDRETHSPYAIPEEQMRRFIQITSLEDQGLEYLGEPKQEWITGQRVRVTGGIFKGTEGYIHRIKGNHRLIVAIEGVVAVATSYIPSAFLEPIAQEAQ